jgi:anti-sigma factor RsiW
MTHAEIEERLALLALGEVELADAREIEAHVAGCDSCRAELLELREAFGAIALSAAPVAPPPELRDRVLAAASAPETARPPSRDR